MNPAVKTDSLHALAQSADANKKSYNYSNPDPLLLETFEAPFAKFGFDGSPTIGGWGTLHIEVPEFSSLCPLTGQPDFAKIIIDYMPRARCVESKSLKLYMMAYRQHGDFHESCVARIANDLIKAMDPQTLVVVGQFTPRGGIPFWPTVYYVRPADAPEMHKGTGVPAHLQPGASKRGDGWSVAATNLLAREWHMGEHNLDFLAIKLSCTPLAIEHKLRAMHLIP